jgi:glyceraldehyde 3-phosphate dehydrogenase
VKLAINGLGRIGRLALRRLTRHPEIEIVGVNDLADTRTLAHLITYDSVHGRAGFPVEHQGDRLFLDKRAIPVSHDPVPEHLPFGDQGARIVLECTGAFTSRDQARRHLQGGIGHVLVSAPSSDADFTAVLGVNHEQLDLSSHRIISNASCTTHCLGPLLAVMDQAFGVDFGLVTAVHSYTNDQRILDLPHTDLRRARAASMSMIPTSTGVVETIDQVLPHLAGRIDGLAIRVPTPDVSLADLSLMLKRDATLESIRTAFQAAAESGPLSDYLEIVKDEIVSVDLTGSPASCLFDPFLTKVMTPRFIKVFGWYDNEYGYAARLVDLARHVLGKLEEDLR